MSHELALGRNGSLVIVSTHSEHLIDATHLSGVRLMAVDDKRYPRVENHYHSQLKGKHTGDFMALRPILDAIGLHYGSHKLLAHDRVVIVEGVADMLYLRAFGALLGYSDIPAFAPARGDNTILLLVPLFISQGIRIKVALDADKRKDNTKARLDRDYRITAQYVHEIPIPAAFSKNKGSGVEDIFSKADFRMLLEAFGATLDPDFDAVANSEYIKRPLPGGSSGPKRLVASWFDQHQGSYKKTDFEQETLDSVRAVLDFCVKDEWFSL